MPVRTLKMMIQPNDWSCLPACAAMLLDMTPAQVIEEIGHDGSEMWFPDEAQPFDRRGFHLQEILDVFVHRNQFLVVVECYPEIDERLLPMDLERFHNYLSRFPGILLSSSHAVAWDGEICWNPIGIKQPLSDFELDFFLAVV